MFEVGKKVIAIATNKVNKMYYKRGQVFELYGIRKSTCKCPDLELDIGDITGMGMEWVCSECWMTGDITDGVLWHSASDFAPYDDSLSELTDHDIIHSETTTHAQTP